MVGLGVGRIEHNGETLLSVKETAEVIGCSCNFVYKLGQSEQLQTRKAQGSRSAKDYQGLRVTLKSVVSYLTSKKFRRGINADSMALAFHQLERRVRVLEAREKRRNRESGPVGTEPDTVSRIAIEDEVKRRHPDLFN